MLAAVLGFVCGVLASLAVLSRLPRPASWEEWSSMRPSGAFLALQAAFVAAFLVAILGLGLPDELRVGLFLGTLGFCAPFFVTGIRLRARSSGARLPAPEPDPIRLGEIALAAVVGATAFYFAASRELEDAIAGAITGPVIYLIRAWAWNRGARWMR